MNIDAEKLAEALRERAGSYMLPGESCAALREIAEAIEQLIKEQKQEGE